jgi:hypothetical protein
MSDALETRNIRKFISVPVEITPADVLKSLTVQELKNECVARGIKLKGADRSSGPKHKIDAGELDDIFACWIASRNIEAALFKLEWALPQAFRGFADAVAKYYSEKRS